MAMAMAVAGQGSAPEVASAAVTGTAEQFVRAQAMLTSAVQDDQSSHWERACRKYVEGLVHLLDVVRASSDPQQRSELLERCMEYLHRAQELRTSISGPRWRTREDRNRRPDFATQRERLLRDAGIAYADDAWRRSNMSSSLRLRLQEVQIDEVAFELSLMRDWSQWTAEEEDLLYEELEQEMDESYLKHANGTASATPAAAAASTGGTGSTASGRRTPPTVPMVAELGRGTSAGSTESRSQRIERLASVVPLTTPAQHLQQPQQARQQQHPTCTGGDKKADSEPPTRSRSSTLSSSQGAVQIVVDKRALRRLSSQDMESILQGIAETRATVELALREKQVEEATKVLQETLDMARAAADEATAALRDRLMCSVCMERERNSVLIPCAHLCTCSECGLRVQRCPVCREPVEKRIVVYIA